MEHTNPCCPEMPEGKQCDYLDFVYRLTHVASVDLASGAQRVPVEVAIHVRIERCSGPLELGNLVYSTTLLPGEKVRLFTVDRRSRFTFDSESQLSYRHERVAEEQFYMDAMDKYMSELHSSDRRFEQTSSSGSSTSQAASRGLLGTLINGPSVGVSGEFNAASTRDFLRELNVQAESSHNRSVEMTRSSSAVSVGEVSSRQHAEGESESHLESSTRLFSNPNRCRAVSYLFYQVNKVQTTRLTVRAIRTRVMDPAGDSSVANRPIANDEKLSVLPAGVLASSKRAARVKATAATADFASASFSAAPLVRNSFVASHGFNSGLNSSQAPLPVDVNAAAAAQVRAQLAEQGILDAKGNVSREVRAELEFEFQSAIPTPGVVVKGCLDECNTCEPALEEQIALELEHQRLKNRLLERQIELLDQAQEYRCCPVGEEEGEDDDD